MENQTKGTLELNPDGSVTLTMENGLFRNFDEMYEAVNYAEEHNVYLEDNEVKIGNQIGALVVMISEGRLDMSKIKAALETSTDGAWANAAGKLGAMLADFSKGR